MPAAILSIVVFASIHNVPMKGVAPEHAHGAHAYDVTPELTAKARNILGGR
jgi:hypothetical protein